MSGMIAVWFSCGAASAVAARLTIDKYGRDRVRVVNSPVLEEHEDNRRFLLDVQRWLGVEIETAVNPKYPAAITAVAEWLDEHSTSYGPGNLLRKRLEQPK